MLPVPGGKTNKVEAATKSGGLKYRSKEFYEIRGRLVESLPKNRSITADSSKK
jgi:hypothetical protein